MKRKASVLFAVATSSAVAMADPTPAPPSQPRTLATGAPACGNVSYKSIESPGCKTATPPAKAMVIVTAVVQDLQQIRQLLAVFDWSDLLAKEAPLTLAEGLRPRL